MEEGRRPHSRRVALAAVFAACGSGAPPAPGPRVGKALGAAVAAADRERVPWRCSAADTPALAEESLTTGTVSWRIADHSLERQGAAAALTIGVIADAAGAGPRTIAALGRLRSQLDQAAPDLVISLGGMGATQPELEATLGTLADRAGWPLVALPGDLEATTAHVAAVAALRGRGQAVVDGRLVRWIALPGATIATLPGAGAIERMVAGTDGCAWAPEDVAAVYAALGERPGVRVAALAEAPREVEDGEPTGELGLVADAAVDVVLHGPGRPAPSPSRSGGRDGQKVALSPGTSDATTRLPDPHAPSAGVLSIKGSAWTWRPLMDR